MSLKGLENAIRNLNSLDRHMVPQASACAVNRVAPRRCLPPRTVWRKRLWREITRKKGSLSGW